MTPPTALSIASLKVAISIAAATLLKLTDALDGMDTCTLPVSGLTETDTSPALSPGS